MESLFYIYIACLVVGGVVVLLSALGGLGGEVGVDADVGGLDVDAGADTAHLGEGVSFLSFLKIRRFFFFAFFFGLMGLLGGLTMGTVNTLFTALGMGLLCAWLGDWIITRMTRSFATSALEPEDFIGLEAVVTVPIAAGSRGKVSGTLKGHTIELLAQSSGAAQELTAGSKVLVLEMQDGVAVVDPQQ